MLWSGVWEKNMHCGSCILPICRRYSQRVVGMDLETNDVFAYNFALQGGYLDKCIYNQKKKLGLCLC